MHPAGGEGGRGRDPEKAADLVEHWARLRLQVLGPQHQELVGREQGQQMFNLGPVIAPLHIAELPMEAPGLGRK